MKKLRVRIEIDSNIEEDEVIIKCKELTKSIQKIEEKIQQENQIINFTFYKDNIEYYIPLNTILFFETSENEINAHTSNEIYKVKYKLYELEEILPINFIRVSKSTILNVDHIFSIEKNLTASSIVQFNKTHKQVYVSRNYYKKLKERINERSNNYEKR